MVIKKQKESNLNRVNLISLSDNESVKTSINEKELLALFEGSPIGDNKLENQKERKPFVTQLFLNMAKELEEVDSEFSFEIYSLFGTPKPKNTRKSVKTPSDETLS